MRIGDVRGFGAARIDDGQPAAARPQIGDAAFDIGHRPDAAVRCQRIAADDDHVLRPVDIGDGEKRVMAIHPQLDELVRHLVDTAGRKHRPGAERLAQCGDLAGDAVIVRGGVADIDRGFTAGGADGGGPRGDFGQRGVPRDRLPFAVDALHRRSQAVGIGFEVGERRCLGADMAAAERIVGIALDAEHVAALGGDDDAAIGFAQVAGAQVGGRHGETLRWYWEVGVGFLRIRSSPPPARG